MSFLSHTMRRGIAAAVVLISLGLAAPASAKVVERIVAVINDSILLLSQLDDRIRPMTGRLRQIQDPNLRKQEFDKLRRKMLDMMIDEELIKQEARRLKLTVKEKDLEHAVKNVMRKNNLTREQLSKALKREGKNIEEYKTMILRPQLLRMRVLNVQVRSRITVTDEEVKALYHKNLRTLGVDTKVRARHIFVAIPQGASSRVVADKRRHARKLLTMVRAKGSVFEEIAKKHSQDSVTRADGGDLGYFGRGTLPSNVDKVVFAMKKGEIKGPLRTERGYHLILLVDRKESTALKFDEAKDDLTQQIYSQKLEKATKAWLKEMRKKSHISIK